MDCFICLFSIKFGGRKAYQQTLLKWNINSNLFIAKNSMKRDLFRNAHTKIKQAHIQCDVSEITCSFFFPFCLLLRIYFFQLTQENMYILHQANKLVSLLCHYLFISNFNNNYIASIYKFDFFYILITNIKCI
jgi:hypothetical protein